ncbi:hypothetical protein Tco_0799417 [Tanacetum coccineum]|uniref:Uncharacterized protein n=1 Tax=Tanacetum coccineum TaxID=301880 RepID=A0ABQ4ZQ95_9ASTR
MSDAVDLPHPCPKKLRRINETPVDLLLVVKSRSAVPAFFLLGAVQIVGLGEAYYIAIRDVHPLIATPEHKDGDHTESLAGTNLRTIRDSQRFVISSDSSHHSVANLQKLNAKVGMRAEYNIREKRRLNVVVEEKNSLLKARDEEIETSMFEVVEKSLRDEVKVLKEQNTALEQERTNLSVKVADLAASVKVREQEVADLDAQVTFAKSQSDNLADRTNIRGRQWLLTHGMELAIAKCLNSTEYLSTLEATIGKAIEKGMQEGLSAGVTHGAEGTKLTDVAAHNPSAEADYLSALQRLQSVNFSLIVELRANKDTSVDTIMNLIRLEDTLAEKLGLTESQPHVNQMMVPIHHSSDQHVIGASTLSLSLDVSSSRVRKIKENIANHVSGLRDVFVPLFEPLSAMALEGTEGNFGVVPGTADTTTALSIVVASTNTVRPISIDDYKVTGADDQATADGNVVDKDANPFPNVDGTELNISE